MGVFWFYVFVQTCVGCMEEFIKGYNSTLCFNLEGGTSALKIGIAIMVLGVAILLSGVYVVMSAPWDLISFENYNLMSSYSSLFGDVFRLLNWGIATFVALLANLFLSGTALMLAGYTLYCVPAIQKQEEAAVVSTETEDING